ncbi:MAG: exopolysaccharide biosynthesis protein [Pseudoxanthomonas sp.]
MATTSPDKPAADGQAADAGLRGLLAQMASDGAADERVRLADMLAELQRGAFGLLLLIGVLPAFIPIPGVAGATSGPLVMLAGLQMLVGLRRPWIPGFVARRGPYRGSVARFREATARPLAWLEKLVRPRLAVLVDARWAGMFTGLLLFLLGLLLSLPIPLTNYPFGLLLLVYVLALLERDGALLLLAWALGIAAVAACILLSGNLLGMLQALWLHWSPS